MDFDPFITFNCNLTNEEKAFKMTLELLIVMSDLTSVHDGNTNKTTYGC